MKRNNRHILWLIVMVFVFAVGPLIKTGAISTESRRLVIADSLECTLDYSGLSTAVNPTSDIKIIMLRSR